MPTLFKGKKFTDDADYYCLCQNEKLCQIYQQGSDVCSDPAVTIITDISEARSKTESYIATNLVDISVDLSSKPAPLMAIIFFQTNSKLRLSNCKILSESPSDELSATFLVGSSQDSFEDDGVYATGDFLSAEVDVPEETFSLEIYGQVDDTTTTVNHQFGIKLNFNQEVDLTFKGYNTETGEEFEVKEYTFSPQIKYTGTIKNIDDFGNALTKDDVDNTLYCLCQSQDCQIILDDKDVCHDSEFTIIYDISDARADNRADIVTNIVDISLDLNSKPAPIMSIYFSVSNSKLRLSNCQTLIEAPVEENSLMFLHASSQEYYDNDVIYAAGDSLSAEIGVSSSTFYLTISGEIDSSTSTVNHQYSIKLNFNQVYLTFKGNNSETGEIFQVKPYTFNPQIKYTGTVTNIDDFGNALTKDDEDSNMYCLCQNENCQIIVSGVDVCQEEGVKIINNIYQATAVDQSIIFTDVNDISIDLDYKVAPIMVVYFSVQNSNLKLSSCKTLVEGPAEEEEDTIVLYASNQDSSEKDGVIAYGISLSAEVDVPYDTFTLGIAGQVADTTVNHQYYITLYFDQAVYLTFKGYNIGAGEEFDVKDYTFNPQIKYSGTVTNIDDFGNALTKDDIVDSGQFCLCQSEDCEIVIEGIDICKQEGVITVTDISQTRARVESLIATNKADISINLNNQPAPTTYIYFSVSNSKLRLSECRLLVESPTEDDEGMVLIQASSQDFSKSNGEGGLMAYGDSLSAEVDVPYETFFLGIAGTVDGKTVKHQYPMLLKFSKKVNLTFLGYDIDEQEEFEVKDYTFDPIIQYTGTVINIDEFGNALTVYNPPTPIQVTTKTSKKSSKAGVIAGVVIAVVVVVGAGIVVAIYFINKRKQNSETSSALNQQL